MSQINPQFIKSTIVKGVQVELKLTDELLESTIDRLASDANLVALMKEYIRKVRLNGVQISEDEEIELRQQIFPTFGQVLKNDSEYLIFAVDIAEEMFRRLETGRLGVAE